MTDKIIDVSNNSVENCPIKKIKRGWEKGTKYNPYVVGIIGGGQLGGLLLQNKGNLFNDESLNYFVKYYIYSPKSPIFPVKFEENEDNEDNKYYKWHSCFQGEYHDYKKIVDFGKKCDIITYELENISVDALDKIKEYGVRVCPDPDILRMVQDKEVQKQFLIDNGFPTPKFLDKNHSEKKWVEKLKTGGYDGRGVQIRFEDDVLDINFENKFEKTNDNYFCEEFIDIQKELSIIVGRNRDKDFFHFNIVDVISNQDNQLDYLIAPADIHFNYGSNIIDKIHQLANILELEGIMAVELFMDYRGLWYINEISPRPHNTGHHTLNYTVINQFSLLNRCLLNLPLSKANEEQGFEGYHLLVNILGKDKKKIDEKSPHFTCFKLNNSNFYYYGKKESFPGRKLGHITYSSDKKIDPYNINYLISRMKHSVYFMPINNDNPLVSVIMGSSSDYDIMENAITILKDFCIPYEVKVVSAHRTPFQMIQYGLNVSERGIKVIIAGAGGAAHLPGMVASTTHLPVIGVPIKSSNSIQGIDSLLSICQMPGGIPVATMAVNGSKNAGLMAARILGLNDKRIETLYKIYQKCLVEKVEDMNENLEVN